MLSTYCACFVRHVSGVNEQANVPVLGSALLRPDFLQKLLMFVVYGQHAVWRREGAGEHSTLGISCIQDDQSL